MTEFARQSIPPQNCAFAGRSFLNVKNKIKDFVQGSFY